MNKDEYVDLAEKRIFKKGMTISTWYTSSRGQKLGDVKADLLARGNMAMKGFLLSRMWSWTSPKWETLAVVFSHGGTQKAPLDDLKKFVSATDSYMTDNDIKWSWIVYASESGFEDDVADYVKNRLKREMGIMLVDLSSNKFVCNNVLVSRHGSRIFKP